MFAININNIYLITQWFIVQTGFHWGKKGAVGVGVVLAELVPGFI